MIPPSFPVSWRTGKCFSRRIESHSHVQRYSLALQPDLQSAKKRNIYFLWETALPTAVIFLYEPTTIARLGAAQQSPPSTWSMRTTAQPENVGRTSRESLGHGAAFQESLPNSLTKLSSHTMCTLRRSQQRRF